MSSETPKLDEPYVVDCAGCDFRRSYTKLHGALVAMNTHNRAAGDHDAGLKHKDDPDPTTNDDREVAA